MDLPENKIICFQQDTAERKRYFKAASFAHPAKMVLGLQIYLIEHYTKPGDVILDPMAGSGTILIACTLGRNVVLVELEDKFVKMQQDNYEKIKRLGPMLGFTMGTATILQGDARNLNGLLADNILFSPPYSSILTVGGDQVDRKKLKETLKTGKKQDIGTKTNIRYNKQNPNNISNLPYGEISAVISSPPYTNRMDGGTRGGDAGMHPYTDEPRDTSPKQRDQQNIGNLPYGKADAVITSPPYANRIGDESDNKGHRNWPQGTKATYPPGRNNIGNLKSENYLEAMLQVYENCHRVLKEKGLMILVVKNFIRDKKIVRLDLDTIKICEQAGFVLKERLKRKLTQQSFWRTIYHVKYPDVEKIEFEDVLVFEKEK